MISKEFKACSMLMFVLLSNASIASEGESGFQPIFDGKSLSEWETPDTSYWTVEDGAITGRITKEHPCSINQYLVWRGGELADFELKLESRLTGEGGINNGFQFRSRLLPDHDVCGYQMDNNLQTPWLVRLYDEFGRHTLAMRGERALYDNAGARTASKLIDVGEAAWFRLEDWHEYHLICIGPKITLKVNGKLAAEVIDNDPRRQELQGILALQLHSGPPTLVQFKNIRLKILKPAEIVAKPVPTEAVKRRTALLEGAQAWWLLDTGGHGAKPTLRHIPGWDQFELNVKADGPGSKSGAKVVVLNGAYFDAGPDLPFPGKEVTVFMRIRDPRGLWNSTLFSKGRGDAEFKLLGTDLPETVGPDVVFALKTDKETVSVSFPISKIEPSAWHDLVVRYDGLSAAIFCDGKLLSAKPCQGGLVKSNAPLIIAAEIEGDKVVRHFRGDMEEVAIWSRAITDQEVKLLTVTP